MAQIIHNPLPIGHAIHTYSEICEMREEHQRERMDWEQKNVGSFDGRTNRCRYCGSRAEMIWHRYHGIDGPSESGFFVRCVECRAAGPIVRTEQDAVCAWNKEGE